MSVTNENIWGYLNRLSASPIGTMDPIGRLYDYSEAERTVTWEVQAKGSTGQIAAMPLIPSPNQGPDASFYGRSLRAALRLFPDNLVGSAKKVEIQQNGIKFTCVILYPKGFDVSNKSKCVLYNNPNGVTVDQLLKDGFDPLSAPYKIFKKTACPMILYDYRGTGVNQKPEADIMPNQFNVILDGISALNYAIEEFQEVAVWGSSLGATVAAIACDLYLAEHPDQRDNLSLYSIDGYTSTKAVILPQRILDIPHVQAPSINAKSAESNLIEQKVKVVALCHLADFVITQEARLFNPMKPNPSVKYISSPKYGHGNLTDDMLNEL